MKFVTIDGKPFDVEVMSIYLIYNNQPSILTIIRDITERKKTEKLREDVERIVRHDLKIPLNAISGFSQMIARKTNEQKLLDYANIIKDRTEYMLGMIENSFDLFKMEEGKYKLKPVKINLIRVFVEIIQGIEKVLKRNSITIKIRLAGTEIGSEDVYMIEGEENHIKTMFANLIKNAVEASEQGDTDQIYTSSDEAHHTICIHNNGVIPEEIRDVFFERYSTSGKTHGTGLGTYSSMLIAKIHNGNIAFTTSEKEGTTLTVVIPKNLD